LLPLKVLAQVALGNFHSPINHGLVTGDDSIQQEFLAHPKNKQRMLPAD